MSSRWDVIGSSRAKVLVQLLGLALVDSRCSARDLALVIFRYDVFLD